MLSSENEGRFFLKEDLLRRKGGGSANLSKTVGALGTLVC